MEKFVIVRGGYSAMQDTVIHDQMEDEIPNLRRLERVRSSVSLVLFEITFVT